MTELALEYGVNINGAVIPGERVRSVSTRITVRPGDTFVNESELAIFRTPHIDRLIVTVNGRESVLRALGLPPLPDSVTGASAFGALGTSEQ